MDTYLTEIKALCPITGELKTWGGPNIKAISPRHARAICRREYGYCRVIGVLVAEIPCKPGTYKPDWSKRVDFDTVLNN